MVTVSQEVQFRTGDIVRFKPGGGHFTVLGAKVLMCHGGLSVVYDIAREGESRRNIPEQCIDGISVEGPQVVTEDFQFAIGEVVYINVPRGKFESVIALPVFQLELHVSCGVQQRLYTSIKDVSVNESALTNTAPE